MKIILGLGMVLCMLIDENKKKAVFVVGLDKTKKV